MNKLDLNNIPNHIAIILDGNGRWAKKRMLPRFLGHKQGAINLKDITLECDKLGIKYLTVFCFSTENWKRPIDEVNYLMTEPIKYFKKYKDDIKNSNIRIKIIGRKDRLSKEFLECVTELENITSSNLGLTLSLCIDYGSYDELTNATRNIAKLVLEGKLNIEDITEKTIEANLYTKDYPKLDLLIRTSGELRISNYLLWQLAYSELYFTDVYWPDFNKDDLIKALISYQNRNRRFGGLNENNK